MDLTDLISKELIKVPLMSDTKEGVIKELADVLYKEKRITNLDFFINDVMEREEQLSTALENGIAIPHAKSASVHKTSIAVGISKEGINCDAQDGEPTRIFFLIASPKEANDIHVKCLAKITSKLLDERFRKTLLNAENSGEIFKLLTSNVEPNKQIKTGNKFLLGVTGCPVGVAHTYLATESLVKTANEIGVFIKVETNGSIGVENSPTSEEIRKADAIIVACDKQVNLERFKGKKVIFAGVKEAIDNPEKLINKAISGNVPVYKGSGKQDYLDDNSSKEGLGLYKYLMNGVSYMIPFVVVGGLLIAISLALGGKPTPDGLQIPEGSMWNKILDVGTVGFSLMIPILAGFIAYAIGDRAALAPGMIGGWIANDGSFYGAEAGTGFIGAIIAGFAVGYIVKWIKTWKFPKAIQPLVPIMIIPVLVSLCLLLPVFHFVNMNWKF